MEPEPALLLREMVHMSATAQVLARRGVGL